MQKIIRKGMISILLPLVLTNCSYKEVQPTPTERLAKQNASCIQTLNDLIQLDVDTYHAYTQAIEGIQEKHIRDTLHEFRADHERHIRILSTHVLQLGGVPTSFTRDFKGFLITGYTAFKRGAGTIGALKAMQKNETISNERYKKSMTAEIPMHIQEDIKKNLEDEKRHLNTINKFLRQKGYN